MTLEEILKNNNLNTDKYNLGYIDNIYENLFKNYNLPVNILEIGIYHGESIKLWKKYFHPLSKIYGMDINHCRSINEEDGIFQIIGDAYSEEKASYFESNSLDIIIDDGPHTFESFIKLIEIYFDKLKPGGILIIEDIIVPNWTKFLIDHASRRGYKNITKYDMAGKQKTKDLYNRWINGLDVLVMYK